MPYKFQTQKTLIPRELRKNTKLSLEERELIKQLYGHISQRKLAKQFGVSRRLIQFYGDENKLKRHLELRREANEEGRYYDREKYKEYMKKHRRYKHQLDLKNLLLKKKILNS